MGRVHLVVLVHGLYGSPSNLDTVAEELRAASAPASAAAPTSTSAPESTYASASKPPSISISTPAPSSTSTPISISAYTSTHPSTSGSSSGTTSALPSTASLSPSTSSPAWPSQNPTTSSTFSTSTANAHVDARGDEEKPTTPSNDGRGNEEKLTRTPSAPRATREPEPDALETVVYLAKGFRGSHTWDGIDVNAWRAAAEVDTELERLEDEGNEVVAFSVMGYSLGGLIARYLVGILHARQPSFFARYRPASFSTAATPHLGVLKYRSTLNTVVHTVGRRLFSRTGRQLYALDREVGGRSLLDVLADPSHIFVQALQLFPQTMIVANGCNDLTVPYPTAAISPTDPFEAHALTGVKVVVSTDHIVQSWVLPSDKADGAPDHVKDLEDLKVFQPAQATPTVPDAPSLPCPASTSVVEGDQGVVTTSSPPTASTAATVSRTRPRVPPILFLPYPFPFRYALFLLLPIIVPLWMLFVSIVFTLHTWQSRRRIWTHHSVHEVRPLLDEEDLSAPLRISHSRLIQLRSDHSTPASSTASTPPLSSPPLNHTDTDDPTSLHHPKQIPLLLTSRQKDMIHNLTAALPQLERLIAWFPYVYNSHGTIIVRDGKRFKAREEGRGIVRAWTRWVVDSARQRGVGDVGSDGVVDVGARDRAPRVKNRAPAAVQITSEQLLREAQERQEPQFKAPKQRVQDLEELTEFQGRKRTEFEGRIRYSRDNIRAWIKYAQWEASQNEFERSRSVFERALDVDPRSSEIWLKYTDMELKARNINHARNLFDRAVTLLPRVDALWYKYVYLEELLLNVPGARQIFERWMQWEPHDKAWQSYIKLEERYDELDRASDIFERWLAVRPIPRNWVIWAKFEEDRARPDKAREVFQTALEFFGDEEEQVEKAQQVFAAFARMETRLKEFERARVIYKFALARLPRSKSASLYSAYTKFEKQHGDRAGVELTVLGKRRIQYEEELAYDGTNYDAWFSLARLEEDAYRADKEDGEDVEPTRVREVYERAVANVPPATEKRFWRRYIYLWLQYAAFEEIDTKDFDRARDVYKAAIKLVPHREFTFAKLWLAYAYFEIRRVDVMAARKVLGAGIGMCPKPKLFTGYIELEMRLREFDRVRILYEKFLTYDPSLSSAWIQWTQVEGAVEDFERVRAIFELAVQQALDMPEIVWKAYIDFEAGEGERERTRHLYERLLERTGHVKVYISYALMEVSVLGAGEDEDGNEIEGDAGDPELSRAIFERGYKDLRARGEKEDRAVLLEAWKSFEEEHGTPEQQAKVQEMMPQTRKRWRKAEDGSGTLEEYWDLAFPDDEREANPTTFKFFQAAQAWAAQRGGTGASGLSYEMPSDSEDEEDEDGDGDGDDVEMGAGAEPEAEAEAETSE